MYLTVTDMKRILVTVILLANVALGFAQQKNSNNFEIGVGVNSYGILGCVGGPGRSLGPGTYIEYRSAFAEHFDAGTQVNYKCGDGCSAAVGPSVESFGIRFNQVAAKVLADYNVCPSRTVNPYVGMGLGIGEMFEKTSKGTKDRETYGTLCPRIGVQIWRIRLAIEVDFAYNGEYGFLDTETSTALNIGFSF